MLSRSPFSGEVNQMPKFTEIDIFASNISSRSLFYFLSCHYDSKCFANFPRICIQQTSDPARNFMHACTRFSLSLYLFLPDLCPPAIDFVHFSLFESFWHVIGCNALPSVFVESHFTRLFLVFSLFSVWHLASTDIRFTELRYSVDWHSTLNFAFCL